mgnify:CR=1 FL=1
MDELYPDETPIDHLRRLRPDETPARLRARLSGFGLGAEQAETVVARLSVPDGEAFLGAMIALRDGGIIVQQSESPLLHTNTIIKTIHDDMKKAGFDHVRTLPFPQPVYPTGWWSCTMAGKEKPVVYFREEDADQRPFVTRYYNADIHRGALAMPQFMVDALEDEVMSSER